MAKPSRKRRQGDAVVPAGMPRPPGRTRPTGRPASQRAVHARGERPRGRAVLLSATRMRTAAPCATRRARSRPPRRAQTYLHERVRDKRSRGARSVVCTRPRGTMHEGPARHSGIARCRVAKGEAEGNWRVPGWRSFIARSCSRNDETMSWQRRETVQTSPQRTPRVLVAPRVYPNQSKDMHRYET
jgi:hypothetical protein